MTELLITVQLRRDNTVIALDSVNAGAIDGRNYKEIVRIAQAEAPDLIANLLRNEADANSGR